METYNDFVALRKLLHSRLDALLERPEIEELIIMIDELCILSSLNASERHMREKLEERQK